MDEFQVEVAMAAFVIITLGGGIITYDSHVKWLRAFGNILLGMFAILLVILMGIVPIYNQLYR